MARILPALLAMAWLLAAAVYPGPARAAYPNKQIRIVIPLGPGGLADITMRLLGEGLTKRTGQPVVIENRPGAGGVVAATAVASAAPDGYTLFVLTSAIPISRAVIKNLPFDPEAAFMPISSVAAFDLLILAKGDSPLRTIADALALARAEPDKFNIGTVSRGGSQNLTAELLRATTKVKMQIVTFRTTGEVATALVRGDVTLAVESYAALRGQIDDGKLRAIVATGAARSKSLPEVPTLRESGVAAEVEGWNGLAAPAGTPGDVIATLNGHIRAIVESEPFKARLRELGTQAVSSTPQEFRARLRADIEKWSALVKEAGIAPK
jgi:tripartite-type tricarboxylate transporter receptor subunit TctC